MNGVRILQNIKSLLELLIANMRIILMIKEHGWIHSPSKIKLTNILSLAKSTSFGIPPVVSTPMVANFLPQLWDPSSPNQRRIRIFYPKISWWSSDSFALTIFPQVLYSLDIFLEIHLSQTRGAQRTSMVSPPGLLQMVQELGSDGSLRTRSRKMVPT